MSQPVKILLVDDIEQNHVVLHALLERPGLELLCALSGPEALELLLEHSVALALLDVHMPGMDGFELAELMRGSPRTRQVPIIFLTAADSNHTRTFRGYDAGAVDFLYKPFDPHILRSKVEVFVELYDRQRQLTQQMKALEDALRTNEMFVAMLGHDLRNPLSSILSLAEVVKHGADNDRIRGVGERIVQSSTRMSRLIDQTLDVALMRAGKASLQPSNTNLLAICQHLAEEFAAAHGAERIVLEAWGNTWGEWDADRLSQVFSNLIGNALQHGGTDPVHIYIDGDDIRHIRVRVVNSGTIPDDIARTMFEPFSRNSRSSHSKGLGLGLYIVREHVHLHKGTVTVQTGDERTVFQVELPRRFMNNYNQKTASGKVD